MRSRRRSPTTGRSSTNSAPPRCSASGADATIVALGLMVPRAVSAADRLAGDGIETARSSTCASLVPLDTATILASVRETGRLFTVEENPRLCGWGAEIVSIVG